MCYYDFRDVIYMTINERIAELRKQRNWSQEELAVRAGFKSKSTISKIENGTRELTRNKIIAFATVFGVSPSYIMTGKEDTDETNKNAATPMQQRLIDELNNLDEEQQNQLILSILAELKKGDSQ